MLQINIWLIEVINIFTLDNTQVLQINIFNFNSTSIKQRIDFSLLYSSLPKQDTSVSPLFIMEFTDAEVNFDIQIIKISKALANTANLELDYLLNTNMLHYYLKNYFNCGILSSIIKYKKVITLEISNIESIRDVII